jgi:hypothetical protein
LRLTLSSTADRNKETIDKGVVTCFLPRFVGVT